MFQRGVELRSEALRRLRQHQYGRPRALVGPHDLADLYVTLGRLQGILAYAASDAGDPKAAMTHAETAWICAERARDNELRVWVRGPQSVITRFEGDYANLGDSRGELIGTSTHTTHGRCWSGRWRGIGSAGA
jgi:hypothetical protein